MWHRLALAWSCTVKEAKVRCSLKEFRRWQAYAAVEPFGADREDLRFAIVAATIATHAGDSNARFCDYMASTYIGERPRQTDDEMRRAGMLMAKQNSSKRSNP